jgi:hypothetical protein
MKFGGALKFFGFLLFAQTARDVAERCVCRKRGGIRVTRDGRAVHGVLRLLRGGWRRELVFARFQLGAIFRRKDVFTLQVFRCVHVLGFFLLALFAGTLLASSFGNVLVFLILVLLSLGAALRSAGKSEGKNQENGNTTP